MSTGNKQKKVEKYLLEEQAKADALYPYTDKSAEPIAEGAWKGALLSGIGKTLHEAHKQHRLTLKGTLGYYAGGGALGALVGYANNKRKVEKAKEARQFLADNRVRNDYVREKKQILKQAALTPDEKTKILTETGVEFNDKKKKHDSLLKSVATNTALGALMGGVGSLATRMFGAKTNILRGAATMGVLSGTQAGLGDEIDRKIEEHNKNNSISPATQMAIATGLSSATEPLIYRSIGRIGGKETAKLFEREELKDLAQAKKMHQQGGVFTKAKNYLLPNLFKKKYDSDFLDMLKGRKGKIFDKDLLGHTAGKALWGSLIGYGMGKALEKLTKKRNTETKT